MRNNTDKQHNQRQHNDENNDNIPGLIQIIHKLIALIGDIHILVNNILLLSLRDHTHRLIHNTVKHRIHITGRRQRRPRLKPVIFPLNQIGKAFILGLVIVFNRV